MFPKISRSRQSFVLTSWFDIEMVTGVMRVPIRFDFYEHEDANDDTERAFLLPSVHWANGEVRGFCIISIFMKEMDLEFRVPWICISFFQWFRWQLPNDGKQEIYLNILRHHTNSSCNNYFQLLYANWYCIKLFYGLRNDIK